MSATSVSLGFSGILAIFGCFGAFFGSKWAKNGHFQFFFPESAQKLFFSPKINEIRLPDASQPLGMSWNHLKHAKIPLFHDFQFRAVLALFYPLGCSVCSWNKCSFRSINDGCRFHCDEFSHRVQAHVPTVV